MNDKYKSIQNIEDYKKVLASGVFPAQFPELKGEWDDDKLIILQGKHQDQKGDIWDFPIEVIDKMVEHQIEQGNEYDVKVFQRLSRTSKRISGGFSWYETSEGSDFWEKVICEKRFDLFFEKYPREAIGTEQPPIKYDYDAIKEQKSKHEEEAHQEVVNWVFGVREEFQVQGIKVSEGKISYSEVCPVYISMMAKRMSRNKEQYPHNNWKKEIDPIELLDAMERHICDLKLLLNGEQPIHNTEERELDHLAAIGCDAQMISYQLNNKKE